MNDKLKWSMSKLVSMKEISVDKNKRWYTHELRELRRETKHKCVRMLQIMREIGQCIGV